FRILFLQPSADRRQFVLRLAGRDAWFKEYETFESARAAILQLVSSRVEGFLHRDRHPELERNPDKSTVKILGRDTNDRVLNTVKVLLPADDCWIALVTVHPGFVTDHSHRMAIAAYAFIRRKSAA